MIGWVRRERHTRGYGVHSPLAFRTLWLVVRPDRDVAFYGEEALRHAWSERASRRQLRVALTLLRLTADLQPPRVWISKDAPEIMHDALRLAGGVLKLLDGAASPLDAAQADMAVVCAMMRLSALSRTGITKADSSPP